MIIVKLRRRTPQQSWRGMQGAAAHQHRFPVLNLRNHAVSDFINAMTCIKQFYHYCLIFTSSYIGFMFIPAASCGVFR
jgi:hypothetical protein